MSSDDNNLSQPSKVSVESAESSAAAASAETPAHATTTTTTPKPPKAKADLTVMRRLTRVATASFAAASEALNKHEHDEGDKAKKSKTKSARETPFARRVEASELTEGGEFEHVVGRVVALQHMAVEALKCVTEAIETYIVRSFWKRNAS